MKTEAIAKALALVTEALDTLDKAGKERMDFKTWPMRNGAYDLIWKGQGILKEIINQES